MKNPKRILVAFVSCLLCMTVFLHYSSAEIIFYPQTSQVISSASAIPAPQGSGMVEAVATIYCTRVVDSLGFNYIRLQENRNGTWVTVKSATSKFTTDAAYYQYTITYSGTPGMSYRAQAGYSETDGGVTETRSSTSGSVTCY